MELNEIKKKLYKENPRAYLTDVRRDGIGYKTGLGDSDTTITFLVPISEIGDVIWDVVMDAKLLIRYIVK